MIRGVGSDARGPVGEERALRYVMRQASSVNRSEASEDEGRGVRRRVEAIAAVAGDRIAVVRPEGEGVRMETTRERLADEATVLDASEIAAGVAERGVRRHASGPPSDWRSSPSCQSHRSIAG